MDRDASDPRDDPFSLPAKDQALLDSLIETSLAEVRAPRPAPAGKAGDSSDPANGFLSSAAAFLTGRPDRDALIELLREAVANAAKPPPDAVKTPASQPPEADDVRSDV